MGSKTYRSCFIKKVNKFSFICAYYFFNYEWKFISSCLRKSLFPKSSFYIRNLIPFSLADVNFVIEKFEEEFLEPELRPEYIEKLKKIEKQEGIKFKSIEALRKHIENA